MDFNGFKLFIGSAGSTMFGWFAIANWHGIAQDIAVVASTLAATAFAVKLIFDVLKSREEAITAKRVNDENKNNSTH